MAGFYLYTSNHLEQLVPVLCDLLKKPRRSVFDPQTVVVQSKGMEQWLTQQIAKHHNICAFIEFPFPNTFFNRLLGTSGDNHPALLPFDPQLLAWRIYSLLPSLADNADFSDLRQYLTDSSPIKRFQLSEKIADLFDQYTMYRPDIISEWEKGSDSDWQAKLWRMLSTNHPSHRQHLATEFLENIRTCPDKLKLPQQISFFGISALPPFFASVTEALSNFIDINYFLLNPCAEFWDDIVSEKELRSISRKRSTKKAPDSAKLHYESGNALLASLGRYGRDFIGRLHELGGDEYGLPIESASDSMLSAVQNQILTLSADDIATVPEHDRSIQIHSCHSRLREIEVLHDSLLHFFNTIQGLLPSDIVVMAPDISEYTPSIQTVFETASDYRLQYSIADQSIKSNAALTQGFLDVLDIVNSRFTSVDIINLLENEPLRKSADIETEDLPLLRDWISRTQIRWAIGPNDKSRLDLPATGANSWEAGLNELLLGFALAPQNGQLFNGIAGSDLIESGDSAKLLGKFLDFFRTLETLNADCSKSYTLKDWAVLLQKTLQNLFKPDAATLHEFQALLEIMARLTENGTLAGVTEEIPFEVIKSYLSEKLESTRASRGFLNGGITFCSLLPMRGIPFKIICLLGMNEGVFPRRSHDLSWDLIRKSPRKGDRLIETEDRYLFLETLLSARDLFYVSYTGQSIQNDSEMHPSVCVEELLDYIDAHITINSNDLGPSSPSSADTISMRSHITFRHRLHAFNPANFSTLNPLPSFRKSSLAGARKLLADKEVTLPFFREKLPDPQPDLCNITISDLTAFYKNPCKYLLSNRLNIFFPDFDEELKTTEAFDIKGLEKYSLSELLLDECLSDKKTEADLQNYYKALNLLPHGNFGSVTFSDLYSDVRLFSETLSTYTNNNRLDDLQIDYRSFSPLTVCGELSSIFSDYQLLYRNATEKPKYLLEAWISHLFLITCKSASYPNKTLLISKDAVTEFGPVSNAQELINDLLATYLRGCKEPLHFFAQSSFNYAELVHVKNKDPQDAFKTVYKSWYYDTYSTYDRESDDPYIKCALAAQEPLDKRFVEMASVVYKPLLVNRLGAFG